jgi:bacillithiol biosynthesis cysteine-adding enzyme BshC
MNCIPLRQVDIAGPETIARAWLNEEESLQTFWPYASNLNGIEERLSCSHGIHLERRKVVAAAIERQYKNTGLAVPEGMLEFRSGARAVTTGHQLVLMGGPAFFHYKILSAIRWAKQLSEKGTAAVPVFWLASEDHDFEEISRVFSPTNQSFQWQPKDDPKGKAVGRLKWSHDDEKSLADWASSNGILPMDSQETFESVSLAQRVRMWVHEIFGEYGVIVIDGDDPVLKKEAMHLWNAEWDNAGISEAVNVSTSALEALGWKAQLQWKPNNLFHLSDTGERMRFDRWDAENNSTGWASVPPENWSPNAALRPLYQEFLLESAAVIGGPGEVAYWLQLGGAFAHHDIELPALILRDGGLVWSSVQAQWAQSIGWNPALGAMSGAEASSRWVTMQLEPEAELQLAWNRWSEVLERYANGVGKEAVPMSLAALKQMEKEWIRLRKKWRKSVRAKHVEQCRELEYLFDSVLFPGSNPQERVLNAGGLIHDAENFTRWMRLWLDSVSDAVEPQFLVFEDLS